MFLITSFFLGFRRILLSLRGFPGKWKIFDSIELDEKKRLSFELQAFHIRDDYINYSNCRAKLIGFPIVVPKRKLLETDVVEVLHFISSLKDIQSEHQRTHHPSKENYYASKGITVLHV